LTPPSHLQLIEINDPVYSRSRNFAYNQYLFCGIAPCYLP
jgi:hypothetical protein